MPISSVFTVPEQYTGKTLDQISSELSQQGRPGLGNPGFLASWLGINQNTPLTSGQQLKFVQDVSPTSGEYLGLVGAFGQPTLPGMTSGGLSPTTGSIVDQAKEILKFTTEANQPVISSLEAQRQPLTDRYSALLDEIKGNQQTAEQRESTASAREFGRRGIPLSSGLYDTTLTERLNPITRSYSNLYKETAAGRESDLLSLAREIAGLQAGNPQQSLSQALQLGGFQQQAQSLAAQLSNQQFQQQLSQQQFGLQEREFGLREKQFNTDPLGIFG